MSAVAIAEPILVQLPGFELEGPTLEQTIGASWAGLTRHRAVACPVCAGEMRPEYGAHALPIGGRCTACGTQLR